MSNALGALTLIVLGVTLGAMARYYMTTNFRRPFWLAFLAWGFAVSSEVIENFGQRFQWGQTPFVLLGCIFILSGICPALRIKRES